MKIYLLKFLTFFKKIFIRQISRNWITYCIKKLFYFFATLANGLLWFIKNPKTIPVLAFFVVVSLCYYIFSEQIFVEDIEIQGEAKEHGFTGASLTEQAVALMPAMAIKRLENLPANVSFLQMTSRYSDNYETEQTCNFSVPLSPPNYAEFITGIDRVEMSSQALDQIITSQTVSIKKLAYQIRKKLKLGEIRQLRPILWKQNGKFILKINPTPIEVSSQQLTFEDLDDAPKKLATILLDYITPEIYAAELVSNGFTNEENFLFPKTVANLFLSNKQKELLVINAWLAGQLDFSKNQAPIKFKYKYYERANQKLLNELDFNIYGRYDTIIKLLIANRILKANCYNECENDIVDKYTGEYRKELANSPFGLLAMLFIDASRKDKSQFYSTVDKLLKKDLRQETDGLFSNFEIAVVASSALVQWGKYSEALNIIETPLPKTLNVVLEPASSVIAFRSMKAGLKALLGDFAEYNQIQAKHFGNEPCAEWVMTSVLSQAIHNKKFHKKLTELQLADLGNNLIKSHERLEKSGLKSHAFYNQWGILEANLGNHQKAYDKYKQALRFEGDKEWVLLNWGYAALANGEYQLAREKFQKSLDIGKIPSAVRGFLLTAWRQSDKKAYVENFESYGEILFNFEHLERSELERAAIIFSCELGIKLTKTMLYPNEGIIVEGKTVPRDQFQKMSCVTPMAQ